MLKDYLPDNVFQKGLQSYLKKFQFSNANTNDLWNSISVSTILKKQFLIQCGQFTSQHTLCSYQP